MQIHIAKLAPLYIIGFFTNRWVLLAWVFTIGLQVCAVYVPFLQDVLHTVPLGWADWGLIFLVALPIFVVSEIYKWFLWHRHQKQIASASPKGTLS